MRTYRLPIRSSSRSLVVVIVFAMLAVNTVARASTWHEEAKLLASDGQHEDVFGHSVAVDGDTLVVGALQDDDSGLNAGSAYVYIRTNGAWTQQAKLLGDHPGSFGRSVDVDGDTAIVGAPVDADNGYHAGAAYVFTRTNEIWTLQAKLLASDGEADAVLGVSVALDGDTAVVGASGTAGNSAYVFTRVGGVWAEEAKLMPSDGAHDGAFGFAVALHDDTAVVGAFLDTAEQYSGSAYVFTRTQGVWTDQAKLLAVDGEVAVRFGHSVDVDGDTILVGSYGCGGGPEDPDDPGDPGDPDGADARDDKAGVTYVFARSGEAWAPQAELVPAGGECGDGIGAVVALDGDTAVIGAYKDDDSGGDAGAAYVFVRSCGVWTQQAKLLASDASHWDQFGCSVAVDADTILIGADHDDLSDDVRTSGSAYVFRLTSTDADSDGIDDELDVCPDTIIPESVPTHHLGVNRWALMNEDGMFDTSPPPGGGNGPDFEFSIEDTAGCSCEQIIEGMALGRGHTKFGCSTGVMLQWIASVEVPDNPETDNEPSTTTRAGFNSLMEGGNSSSASTSGTARGPGEARQQPQRRAPQRRNRQE